MAISFVFRHGLTATERSELLDALRGLPDVEILDRGAIQFIDLPDRQHGWSSAGRQFSYGIDTDAVLLIAVTSGVAVFLKKVVEEAAVEFWRALKKQVGRLARTKKAAPTSSIQLQCRIRHDSGVEVLVVVSCLNVRFVSDDAWLTLIGQIQATLNAQLGGMAQNPSGSPGSYDLADGPPRHVVLHVVSNGQMLVSSSFDRHVAQ